MTDRPRRRAQRPATFPPDQLKLRQQTNQEWAKSARARADYRPTEKEKRS